MCYLVLMGVPDWYAGRTESQPDFNVDKHDNPSVAEAFGPSFVPFALSVARCSCSMYTEPPAPPLTAEADRKRKRLRHRGWSEAQVERAILDSAAIADRSGARPPGLWSKVGEFIAATADAAGEVKLLIHRYSRPFDEEQFTWTGPKAMDADSLRDQYPFATDVVYVVRTWKAE